MPPNFLKILCRSDSQFKTLGNRGRNKKEQPKFATLQKTKEPKGSGIPGGMQGIATCYSTVNIKTNSRQQRNVVGGNDPSGVSAIPINSPSGAVNYEEAPRYINLRTFRENSNSLCDTSTVQKQQQPLTTNASVMYSERQNQQLEKEDYVNNKHLIMNRSSSNHIGNAIEPLPPPPPSPLISSPPLSSPLLSPAPLSSPVLSPPPPCSPTTNVFNNEVSSLNETSLNSLNENCKSQNCVDNSHLLFTNDVALTISNNGETVSTIRRQFSEKIVKNSANHSESRDDITIGS